MFGRIDILLDLGRSDSGRPIPALVSRNIGNDRRARPRQSRTLNRLVARNGFNGNIRGSTW